MTPESEGTRENGDVAALSPIRAPTCCSFRGRARSSGLGRGLTKHASPLGATRFGRILVACWNQSSTHQRPPTAGNTRPSALPAGWR